jgi:hypothetical protein
MSGKDSRSDNLGPVEYEWHEWSFDRIAPTYIPHEGISRILNRLKIKDSETTKWSKVLHWLDAPRAKL